MSEGNDASTEAQTGPEVSVRTVSNKSFITLVVACISAVSIVAVAWINNRSSPSEYDRFREQLEQLSHSVGAIEFKLASTQRDNIECDKRQVLIEALMKERHDEFHALHKQVHTFQSEKNQKDAFQDQLIGDCMRRTLP